MTTPSDNARPAASQADTVSDSTTDQAPLPTVPKEPAAPQPAPDAPYRQPDFAKRVSALIKGEVKPTAGTEDLVDDLKDCAQKQDEARQALQQVNQYGQTKQAEIFGLEGQADALMKVLYRLEKAKSA